MKVYLWTEQYTQPALSTILPNGAFQSHRCALQCQFKALRFARDAERTILAETRRLPCLLLECCVKFSCVLSQPCQVVGGPKLAYQPCRMPCRSRCEAFALKEYDILPAKPSQVVSDTASRNPTTDDHNLCMTWNFADQIVSPSKDKVINREPFLGPRSANYPLIGAVRVSHSLSLLFR